MEWAEFVLYLLGMIPTALLTTSNVEDDETWLVVTAVALWPAVALLVFVTELRTFLHRKL